MESKNIDLEIKRGEGRGYIDEKNNLKILFEGEGIWVKVIAMNSNHLKGIGIMQNTMLGGQASWGELVEFESNNPDEIPKFIKKVNRIPNNEDWTTEF